MWVRSGLVNAHGQFPTVGSHFRFPRMGQILDQGTNELALFMESAPETCSGRVPKPVSNRARAPESFGVMTSTLRLATRRSPLALAQANIVAKAISNLAAEPPFSASLVPTETKADQILDQPLWEIGGKGLFQQGVDQLLFDDRADLSVHSAKDLDGPLSDSLVLVACLERANPYDCLIVPASGPENLSAFPEGACIGTSAPRRIAFLRHLAPHVATTPIRGNITTRVNKLLEGYVDALLLAQAGFERLPLDEGFMRQLMIHDLRAAFIPAPAQGILAIIGTKAKADAGLYRGLENLDHDLSRLSFYAERAFVAVLDANCHTALAAHSSWEGAGLTMSCAIFTEDFSRVVKDSCETVEFPVNNEKRIFRRGQGFSPNAVERAASEVGRMLALRAARCLRTGEQDLLGNLPGKRKFN